VSIGLLTPAFGAANFDKLLSTATERWGVSIIPTFDAWRQLIQTIVGASEVDRVYRVNTFFNESMKFGEDAEVWGQADYWATTMESLGRGAGDCEDYVIAKYFTLLEAGVPMAKLRLVYVNVKREPHVPPVPHMILAYYAQADSDPLVLDSLIADIQPASRRADLIPVISFHSNGIFRGFSGNVRALPGGISRFSRWEDLLKRARAEGFE
jgi:predicted transglutaminase-like cysteine proteinase